MGAAKLARNKPQIPQNLHAQFVCPSTKVLDFNEKMLHWASVVRGKVTMKTQNGKFQTLISIHTLI